MPTNEASFEGALLEVQELELRPAPSALDVMGRPSPAGAPLRGGVRVEGSSVCCLGKAAALVHAMTHPERIAHGEIRCWKRTIVEHLRGGSAGYAPARVPSIPSAKLAKTLTMSARLAGFGKADVMEALERCHIAGHAGRRWGELDPLSRRLAGIAHGLCGNPRLLILEDPFSELDDESAELVLEVLEDELSNRSWIASITDEQPLGRLLAGRADHCLLSAGGEITGPLAANQLTHSSSWVVFRQPADAVRRELENSGIHATETARPEVLLVHQASGLAILRAAQRCDVQVLEVEPTGL